MTKKVLRPILPIPPDEYDPVYLNQLVRILEQLINEVRSSDVNFQGIPSSGSANSLDQGDFYIADGGFIKLVVATDFFSGSVIGTTSIGSGTVSGS